MSYQNKETQQEENENDCQDEFEEEDDIDIPDGFTEDMDAFEDLDDMGGDF